MKNGQDFLDIQYMFFQCNSYYITLYDIRDVSFVQ